MSGFEPVVESPLLVRRPRSSGGTGGVRVLAGWLEGGGLAVVVERSGREPSVRRCASALEVAHAYNAAVREARRAGLGSRPEPVDLTADAFERALAALGA